LTDAQFKGFYHGRKHHKGSFPGRFAFNRTNEDDLGLVIDRAKQVGVEKLLVTGSNLEESEAAIQLCETYPGILYSTVGVHPCHSTEIEDPKFGSPAEYLDTLQKLAIAGKEKGVVKTFGEIGLDYDRLHYAPADTQRTYFKAQLEIATKLDLPLFLHSRACQQDFHSIIAPYIESGRLSHGGVVHSFTGNLEEAQDLLSLGLHIGINGCSLKTQENLDVIREIPLDRIMLETDGPWCEIRPSHASFKQYLTQPLLPFEAVKKEKFVAGSMVRGRCEPCSITLVAKVVSGVKGLSVEEVAEASWQNAMKVFHLN
jgi:TatD DNase family protein